MQFMSLTNECKLQRQEKRGEKGVFYIACLKMRPERVGSNMFK